MNQSMRGNMHASIEAPLGWRQVVKVQFKRTKLTAPARPRRACRRRRNRTASIQWIGPSRPSWENPCDRVQPWLVGALGCRSNTCMNGKRRRRGGGPHHHECRSVGPSWLNVSIICASFLFDVALTLFWLTSTSDSFDWVMRWPLFLFSPSVTLSKMALSYQPLAAQ